MSRDQIGRAVVTGTPGLSGRSSAAAIELSEQGDTAVVRLRGPLDAALTRSLGDALTWAIRHHSAVLVDLSGVPAADACGLGALARAQRRAVGLGTDLCLVGASEQVLSMVRALRLDDLFAAAVAVAATRQG